MESTDSLGPSHQIMETLYHLPTAEYYRFGPSLTCQQVLSEAQAAAATVRPKHAALVTEAGNIRWDGLPLV